MYSLARNLSPPSWKPTLFPILLFCFLVAVSFPVFGQFGAGSVSVRVGDAENEVPIPQADVRLYVFGQGNFSYQAYADAGGSVAFGIVAVGKYMVVASARGYDTAQEEIDVVKGQSSYAFFRLRHTQDAPRPKAGGAVSSAALSIPRAARKEFEAGRASLATDPSASIPHFRKAIYLYPKFAEAHVFLAAAYLKLHKREDAIGATDQAIQADPAFSQAHTLRGRLWLEDRKFNNSEASLKESNRLDPSAW